MGPFLEKYVHVEEWEKAYDLSTAEFRRISKYSGLSFAEILNLPYSAYLLLRRDSWIDSWQQNPDGREFLKDLWRLSQTEADLDAVRRHTGGE